ncbi:MAG TPA: DUF4115 domain-containing protein [Thermoanaerobaculia bacterium]|nr:DUF4115 domain-containing protein [Thermoanaerobaculia bacterium]HUM30333.1 DUF4115 domain-containing protein [Thermoanaerobaculia bacterium]HXK68516.1 DUF4115 domain-containing protein [Thermoanaerobaculia bacterium]
MKIKYLDTVELYHYHEWVHQESDRVGTILKQSREAKGISLEDVARKSNIALRYLRAIEEHNFQLLPNEVFARAFIRQYARIVGLESEEAVELYRRERGTAERKGRAVSRNPVNQGFFWVFIVCTILVGIFGLVFLFQSLQNSGVETPENQTSIRPTEPEPEPATAKTVPVVEPTRIDLTFLRRCWITITLDGKKVFEGVKEPGDRLSYSLRESLAFRAGDGGAVQVERGGEPYPIQGRDGQPLDVTIGIEDMNVE